MLFEPPRYGWTAGTVYDAEKLLSAAKRLIEAHMDTLEPDQNTQWDAKRAAPLRLRISLDLTPVVERINGKHTQATQEEAAEHLDQFAKKETEPR